MVKFEASESKSKVTKRANTRLVPGKGGKEKVVRGEFSS